MFNWCNGTAISWQPDLIWIIMLFIIRWHPLLPHYCDRFNLFWLLGYKILLRLPCLIRFCWWARERYYNCPSSLFQLMPPAWRTPHVSWCVCSRELRQLDLIVALLKTISVVPYTVPPPVAFNWTAPPDKCSIVSEKQNWIKHVILTESLAQHPKESTVTI